MSKSDKDASIDVSELKPVQRIMRLVLEENTPIEVTIWKIKLREKFFQGESQGDFPTFEIMEKGGKEPVMLQSKSASSYAMLDDWDDRKAPCNCYVWMDTTGSRKEIKWAYID